MIIRILTSVEVSGRWFQEGQQYLYEGIYEAGTTQSDKKYITTIGTTTYYIPVAYATVTKGTIEEPDLTTDRDRLIEYIERDPVIPAIYPNGDYIKASKDILGQNIGARQSADQADYNEVRIQQLRNIRTVTGQQWIENQSPNDVDES